MNFTYKEKKSFEPGNLSPAGTALRPRKLVNSSAILAMEREYRIQSGLDMSRDWTKSGDIFLRPKSSGSIRLPGRFRRRIWFILGEEFPKPKSLVLGNNGFYYS